MSKLVYILLIAAVNSVSSKTARIIGGQLATAGQFPYSAAIYKRTADGTYFCGGTLFHHELIITSGYCVYNATSFTIRLGTNHLNSNDNNTLLLSANTYFLHPDFNPDTLDNDIGVIKLRMWVPFTEYIRAVDFLPTSELQTNTETKIYGWGHTSDEDVELADELRWVTVSTLSNEECKIIYGNQLSDSMVCVSGNYNEGACIGDSGGPLLHEIRTGWFTMVGVSSFLSQNGCESTDPSGYTRVFPYVEWLYDILQNPTQHISEELNL